MRNLLLCVLFSFFLGIAGTGGLVRASENTNTDLILTSKSASMQIAQAEAEFNKNNLAVAYKLIMFLRPILAETTELHSQLFTALKDDQNATATAEREKELTIEFAKLRDRANYLAGMICIKQGHNMEAVKHLVSVVESQRSTGLGRDAYNALRSINFSPKLSIEDQI